MLAAGRIRLGLSRALVDRLVQNGTERIIGSGPVQIQVATLTATHGETYPYAKPWPYERKPVRVWHELTDSAMGRMNENSKIITVEGNVGIGKKAFAERLAKEFDLKVFDPTPDKNCFLKNGFDVRMCDDLLPAGAKAYDLKRFLSDPNLSRGTAGKLQIMWYQQRFYTYLGALRHLLNTGQGVVIVRSVYSDHVYAETLRRMGFLSKNFMKFYYKLHQASIVELLKPHLTIYLDAPLQVVKNRIKQRNNPGEVNLTDDFLQQVDAMYKKHLLPKMRDSGEVMEIDWTEPGDDLDMDAIAEEFTFMSLEGDGPEGKFSDWAMLNEEELHYHRRLYQEDTNLAEFFVTPTPFDCPEILLNDEEAEAYDRHVMNHPAVVYERGWAPELGHSTLLKI